MGVAARIERVMTDLASPRVPCMMGADLDLELITLCLVLTGDNVKSAFANAQILLRYYQL